MVRGLRALAWALVLLAAAAGAGAARAEGVTLQWFGQAAVKITTPGGKVIVIDPFISKNPKTPAALKDLAKLGPVDPILLTHGHGDHIGDTVAIAKANGATVFAAFEITDFLGEHGAYPICNNQAGTSFPEPSLMRDAITIDWPFFS